jgi:UDP-N-acetylglucosamine--N-acetylmuramyl-(pentapeptide) pyrophosphoryl-undecaprenol N-acetylglucosamine transferase
LGSDVGLEKELIPRAGYELRLIKARPLKRQFSCQFLSAPLTVLLGCFQARQILKDFRPEAVIAFGGYASLPVMLAAKLLHRPLYLHEQNVRPGLVTRLGRPLAKKLFLSWPESLRYLPGEVVGNPVRRSIVEAEPSKSAATTILVVGGSQGARRLNERVVEIINQLPDKVRLIHLVGTRDYHQSNWEANARYQPVEYAFEISPYLAQADLVISRAGATAITEFLARGLPMILIPYPYASDNHQQFNAQTVSEAGAALIIKDADLTAASLMAAITQCQLNYVKMSQAAKRLAKPEAAERIIKALHDGN